LNRQGLGAILGRHRPVTALPISIAMETMSFGIRGRGQ
jgi:hypothetical protein